jgi:hypothetical protein
MAAATCFSLYNCIFLRFSQLGSTGTPAEIRDVVAYLSGLKPKATKAKPVKAKK